MTDIVKIDRAALLDLLDAIRAMSWVVGNMANPVTADSLEEETQKLKYVAKLVGTALQSYEKHNQ